MGEKVLALLSVPLNLTFCGPFQGEMGVKIVRVSSLTIIAEVEDYPCKDDQVYKCMVLSNLHLPMHLYQIKNRLFH